ncbi:hypothetical protein FQN57_002347 [Myotisia sp. PD_48]|nr:hypothetical protein FQN57_002347 [Myotisia sp. PD_48]
MSNSSSVAHRRTHNLLLISKLLNLREGATPLTLILDTLEQPAAPLLREYIRRAKLSKGHVTFVSYQTFPRPADIDTFVYASGLTNEDVAKEVISSCPTQASRTGPAKCLVIFDSIHQLICKRTGTPVNLPDYLTSLLGPTSPQMHISLVVVYHQDIPESQGLNPYAPSPLTLLKYLATSIIKVHSMHHLIVQKEATDKSLAPPAFGLDEGVEGLIVRRATRDGNREGQDGIVLELEHRRKSGRGVVEWYYLPSASEYRPQQAREVVILLDDHPVFKPKDVSGENDEDMEPESTFELGLTDRQRRDRDNVVLPYFDAQKGDGPGEGGRILYDLGKEDDFDEEEDEI